ncbi:ATP-binding domain-containing protein [Pseudoxanthomonas suwonensis]|uniref:Dph6-related ATP pyrophosphatase n=1 Tax=Pseudoxanthomonas suwonensis TaxID=314722 RepID=UPI0004650A51|nr:ATP-binding domain-containing protein [Pseudoxanthomonas suwonensis]
MAMQVLLAWSGGKDAAWALHTLRQRGEVEVVGLLSTVTREDGRASLQGVRREVLQAQARAAGLPLLEASIPAQCDNATYAAAMQAVLEEAKARWPGIRHAAFGDLFLEDIRAWREQRLAEAGWELLVPLFGSDTAALAREMQAGGLRARLSCVDTAQLDAGFAGRDFDADFLDALPANVDPCGENGEFHSCVWAGPMFAAPLQLERGGTELRDGRYAFTDYRLAGQAG